MKPTTIHTSTFVKPLICILLVMGLIFFSNCAPKGNDPDKEEWISLFDGSNYQDWTPKFTGYPLGENHNGSFVFQDSLLSVRYQEKDSFNGGFGHLFHKKKFSHYRLKATYRFVGEQMTGGPAWAIRNNGLMLHSQDPKTMGIDQDFPISLEMQLLGGDGEHERTNGNLCTPGTNVVIKDSLIVDHCVTSTSKTYHGNGWVTIEALVLGDSLMQHILDDKVVLEYSKPTIGGGMVEGYLDSAYEEGKPIKEGYISIQAETAPIDFKSIEVLDLCGCTDKKAKNYKSYYVKSDNSECIY
ncbi:3-keto-disaccharide hydrolase [Flagellimonas oceanensis]|uniref:3-keto-disaccharide hydrolase n=1 Tax=Flagellimonas oceanensis TaxID=2499163 RepID=UPI003BA8DCF0